MQLENKSIRDVALRVRWTSKKENGNFGKGRKDDVKLAQGSKDKKEATSSLFAAQPPAARSSLFVARPPAAGSSHVVAQPLVAVSSHVAAQPPATMQSHFATQFSASQLVPGTAMVNIDGGISYDATEGVIREQLDQNTQALSQISRNLASGQVQGSV